MSAKWPHVPSPRLASAITAWLLTDRLFSTVAAAPLWHVSPEDGSLADLWGSTDADRLLGRGGRVIASQRKGLICCDLRRRIGVAELANAARDVGASGRPTPELEVPMSEQHTAAKKAAKTPKPRRATAAKRARQPKLGATTKRPADLTKAVKQPLKGKTPTAAMVERGRREWGITPYVKNRKWIAVRPKRGWLVHAALEARAAQTLCTTRTAGWKNVELAEPDDLNCLWCMCRIETFGAKS